MHDLNDDGILAHGRDILRAEGEAVLRAADAPDASFCRGVRMILDDDGTLGGIFTDSDLARLFERRHDAALDEPIGRVMTPRPTTLPVGTRLRDAVTILETRRLSELPVLDQAGRPVGLVDIVDLVGLVPPELLAAPRPAAAA